MRIGLVSCVKSKRPQAAPARDLYTSALFRGARCFVERSCDCWYVLSAEHGLVPPDRVLAPYERTLTTDSSGERRVWASRVLAEVEQELGRDLSAHQFELHAGRAYVAFGLASGLTARGAKVREPLEGLRQGERLGFYKRAGCL